MKITLYKNCIFSRSYSEVYDCWKKDTNGKCARDNYLDTLESEIFEIDTVYSTNSGTLNIPISFPHSGSNIYDFNYAKIEFENISRFCFIDDIQFRNYVAIITYSEDIWHSYQDKIKRIKGFLTNTLALAYNEKTVFPLSYPDVFINDQVLQAPANYISSFVIIAQAQFYTTTTAGERSYTTCATVRVAVEKAVENDFLIEKSVFSFDEAIKVANSLLMATSTVGTLDFGFEVSNITILDASWTFWGTQAITNQTPKAYESGYIENPFNTVIGTKNSKIALYANYNSENDGKIHQCFSITKAFSWDIVSVGTFSSNFDYVANGNDFNVRVNTLTTDTDFKVIISFQGQFIDITPYFVYDVPFTALNSAEFQQRQIANNTQKIQGVANIISGGIGLAGDVATLAVGGVPYNAGSEINKYIGSNKNYGALRRAKALYNQTQLEAERRNEIISSTTDTGAINSIVNGSLKLYNANAEIYRTQTGTFNNGNRTLDIKMGVFFKKRMSSQEAQNRGHSIVKEIGLNTGIVIENEVFEPTKQYSNDSNYNVIKFNFVLLSGSFPQSVCEQLKKTLMDGVKIYYGASGF